jgi:tripartite-type tricarboxylate transporter receptor subunit TctC
MRRDAIGAVARIVLAAFVLSGLQMTRAAAQSAAEFYRGRSIDLQIGYSVGGGYDLYARLVARHLGGHIPGNPTIVPRNMEGAGSLRLANYL